MKTGTIISILLLTFVLSGSLHTVSAQTTELIIQFEDGHSPNELETAVVQKNNERDHSRFGKLKDTIQNVTSQLSKETKCEDRLKRLGEIDKQAGLLQRSPLFNDSKSIKGVYLNSFDGSRPLNQLIIMYESLPEVYSVELNYLASSESYPSR